jgi:hypothetical protein
MSKPWRDADLLSGRSPCERAENHSRDFLRVLAAPPTSWLDYMDERVADAYRHAAAPLGSMTAQDYGPFPFSADDYYAVAQHPCCHACGAEVEPGEQVCALCDSAGRGDPTAAAITFERVEQAQGWRP